MTKTMIHVDTKTRNDLLVLKASHGHKSIDMTIRCLLDGKRVVETRSDTNVSQKE